MKTRKSIDKIICWSIFTLGLIAIGIQNICTMFHKIPQDKWFTEIYLLAGITIGSLIGVIIIRTIVAIICDKVHIAGKAKTLLEVFFTCVLIIVSIGIRFFYMMQMNVGSIGNKLVAMASIGKNEFSINDLSNISKIHILLLHSMFQFFGNKNSIVITLQIAFQVIAVLCIFFSIKMISGYINAFLITIGTAMSKPILDLLFADSDENLLFCFIAFCFFLLCIAMKSLQNLEFSFKKRMWTACFTVGVISLCLFVNVLCAIILVLFVLFIIRTRKDRWKLLLTTLLTIIIVISGVLLICGIYNNGEIVSYLNGVWNNLIKMIYFKDSYLFPFAELEVSFGMIFITMFWIVGFWLEKREENDCFFIMLVILCIARLFVHTNIRGEAFFQFSWIAAFICSIQSVCTKTKTVSEAIQSDIISDGNYDKYAPIPNPLPLPKKHIHREMDYAIDVKDKDMDYDLKDIDENDDFDIK